MAIQKQILTNGYSEWSINQRYKVNSVVTKDGKVYQNTTGANSNPDLLSDWVLIGSDGALITPYADEFAYVDTNVFTVPSNLVIVSVLFNGFDTSGYGVSGTSLTISDALTVGDVIKVRGILI